MIIGTVVPLLGVELPSVIAVSFVFLMRKTIKENLRPLVTVLLCTLIFICFFVTPILLFLGTLICAIIGLLIRLVSSPLARRSRIKKPKIETNDDQLAKHRKSRQAFINYAVLIYAGVTLALPGPAKSALDALRIHKRQK